MLDIEQPALVFARGDHGGYFVDLLKEEEGRQTSDKEGNSVDPENRLYHGH